MRCPNNYTRGAAIGYSGDQPAVVVHGSRICYTPNMERGTGATNRRKGAVPRTVAMAERYWESATDELGVARTLHLPNQYFAAAQHAHQAAEKALKAACWYLRAEEQPYSHDLALLRELLVDRVDTIPQIVRTESDRLDPLYGLSRYPSGRVGDPRPSEMITDEQARAAIAAAEQVMTWVEELLRLAPGKPRRGKKS